MHKELFLAIFTLHHLRERPHSSLLPLSEQCGIICVKLRCVDTAYKKLDLSLLCLHRT